MLTSFEHALRFDNVLYFCRPELTMLDSAKIGKHDLMRTKQLELDDLEVDKEIITVVNHKV